MKTKLFMTVSALVLSSSMAFAALSTNGVVADLQAQGYSRIEVETGPTQTKIEAINGTEKLEVIYDNATGAELKREVYADGSLENGPDGVFFDNSGRDFIGGDDNGDVSAEDMSDDNGSDTSDSGDDDNGSDTSDSGDTSDGDTSDGGDDNGGDSGDDD